MHRKKRAYCMYRWLKAPNSVYTGLRRIKGKKIRHFSAEDPGSCEVYIIDNSINIQHPVNDVRRPEDSQKSQYLSDLLCAFQRFSSLFLF